MCVMLLNLPSDSNPTRVRLSACLPAWRAEARRSNTPLRPWISTRPGRILEGVEGYCAVACLGLADGREAGDITGAWLVWYDPAGNNGDGDAAWSHDPADAARFTEREWAELYAAAPANRPRRPDGKPNRPITIFNLVIVPVRPGELPSIPPAPEAVSPQPQPRPTRSSRRGLTDGRRCRGPPGRRGTKPLSPPPRPPPPGQEPDPDKPDLSKPGALTESLRAMGLM